MIKKNKKMMNLFNRRQRQVWKFIEIKNDYISSYPWSPWAFRIDFFSLDKYLWQEDKTVFTVNFGLHLGDFFSEFLIKNVELDSSVYRISIGEPPEPPSQESFDKINAALFNLLGWRKIARDHKIDPGKFLFLPDSSELVSRVESLPPQSQCEFFRQTYERYDFLRLN